MTETDIAAIEARWKASTPGEWRDVRTKDGFGNPLWHVLSGHEDSARHVISSGAYGEGGGIHVAADAAFIAHAHQDIPALLAYIEELETRIAAALALADQS